MQVVYASEGRLSRDFFCTPVRKNGSVAGRYKVSKEEVLRREGKENEAVRERLSRVSCLTSGDDPGKLCGKVLSHRFHVFSSGHAGASDTRACKRGKVSRRPDKAESAY